MCYVLSANARRVDKLRELRGQAPDPMAQVSWSVARFEDDEPRELESEDTVVADSSPFSSAEVKDLVGDVKKHVAEVVVPPNKN